MSLDELQQRLVAARGRNKQEISRLFTSYFELLSVLDKSRTVRDMPHSLICQ